MLLMLLSNLMTRRLMAPDDPNAGAGGGAPPAPPPTEDPPADPPADPKFTDKDMAAIRRKHERELKIRDKKLEEQEARLKKLEAGNDLPPPPPPPADDDAGQIELMEKRHRREMESAQADAAEARKIAENERTKRREVVRDRALSDALGLAGVAPTAKEYAISHFRSRIVWDDVDDDWRYKTKNGNLVDIGDGVCEEMPDMFKSPRTSKTGAGTQSGMPPTKARLTQQLAAERQKLNDLRSKGGRLNSNVLAFTKQDRVVRSLEAQIANGA